MLMGGRHFSSILQPTFMFQGPFSSILNRL
ncbi:UNVERIFIED_CONTAM: hypothetical protein GTU68_051940 [Idotea baltica]|nr:hypothetical protein [Idotea baltica]